MSLERIIEALIGVGLSRRDSEVYVYLAKKGPKTIVHLTKTLIYSKQEINQSLITLQTSGLLTKNQILFCALPFEEALGLLIETKKKQAQSMHENKEELLASWETKEY